MRNDWETPPTVEVRIPVKLNSDSGICEHHFRKVCGQGFFEQKLSFEGRHLFDSLNKPAAKRSAAVVDPRRWNSANSTSKCDTRLCRLTVLFEYLDRLPESETFPRS